MSVRHRNGTTIVDYTGEADAVRLATFMPRFPKDLAFTEVAVGRWELELDLPEGARIEYLLEVERDGARHAFPDPTNPDRASNPFGANSVATGPGYVPPPWSGMRPPWGVTLEIRVASLEYGGRRHHHLHTPADCSPDAPLPLLVVHDGSDYLRFAGLARCVAWLMAQGTMPAHRLLLLEPRHRHEEYTGSGRHTSHVVDEVIPHVRRLHHVVGDPVVMGASLGAVAAWHIVHEAPERFSGALLQSGTFAFEPHPELSEQMYDAISKFVTRAEHHPLPMPVAVSCGRYESLIDWNRRVAASLAGAGVDVWFKEAWAGHDWGAWADSLVGGLSHIYRENHALVPPGPNAPR